MFEQGMFYYFSPTGGTKKVGRLLCKELFGKTISCNFGKCEEKAVQGEIAVIAIPVFGGRVPTFATEQIRKLDGKGRKAITLAVYGNRHYDDALLELNDLARECGFTVVASAALVAQHSIVPEAGAGRPDEQDVEVIKKFADDVKAKLERGDTSTPKVPGNVPYKEMKPNTTFPITAEGCTGCGRCQLACPVNAISVVGRKVTTNEELCFLCMACVASCPKKVRVLPAPVIGVMSEKLTEARTTYRENECFF